MKFVFYKSPLFKVGALFFIAAAVPTIAVSSYFQKQELDKIKHYEKIQTDFTLTTIAEKIDYEINNCIQNLIYLSELETIISETSSIIQKENELRKFKNLNESFSDITLLDTNGKVITSLEYSYQGDWKTKSWYKLSLTEKISVSPVYLSPGSHAPVMTIFVPIFSQPDIVTEVLSADVNMNQIFSTVNQKLPDKSNHIIITDSSGKVLYHPESNYIQEDFPGNNSNYILTQTNKGNFSFISNTDKPADKYCFFKTMEGYGKYPGQGWRICLIRNNTQKQLFISEIIYNIITLSGFCIISATFIVIIFNKHFLTPLKQALLDIYNFGTTGGNNNSKDEIIQSNSLVQTINNIGQKVSEYLKLKNEFNEESMKYKQKKQKLKETVKHLREINKGKDELLEDVAFRAKTPLSSIVSNTEEILLQDISPEISEKINAILKESENLLNIINETTENYEIQAGKVKLDMQAIDLPQTIETARQLTLSKAQSKNLEIELNCAETMPQYVITDQMRFRQILVNLLNSCLDNATKEIISVNISAMINDSSAKLRLAFSGSKATSSINKDIPIFSQKEKVDSKSENTIVSPVTRGLIELLEGEIIIKESDNDESLIFFELPVSICSQEQIKTIEADNKGNKDNEFNPSFNKQKILLVENYKTNQNLVINQLKRLNLIIELVQNGREAVDKAKNTEYDLILIDLQMPIMNGYIATRLIRSLNNHNSKVPIIAMTDRVGSDTKQQCLDSDINDLLAKPIRFTKLAAVLEQWLMKDKENHSESESIAYIRYNIPDNIKASENNLVWDRDKAIEFFGNNEMLMTETIHDFLINIEHQIHKINDAIDSSHLEIAQREVHKIINGASGIGADKLSVAAQTIESCIKNKEIQLLDQYMWDLSTNYDLLKAETRKQL